MLGKKGVRGLEAGAGRLGATSYEAGGGGQEGLGTGKLTCFSFNKLEHCASKTKTSLYLRPSSLLTVGLTP